MNQLFCLCLGVWCLQFIGICKTPLFGITHYHLGINQMQTRTQYLGKFCNCIFCKFLCIAGKNPACLERKIAYHHHFCFLNKNVALLFDLKALNSLVMQ